MPAGLPELHVVDWVVLVVHVVVSVAVGAKVGGKNASQSREEYFLAGRSQSPCLVGVGLLSGLMSGISYLGSPGYSYTDGAPYLVAWFGSAFWAPIAAYVIMPFYHSLGLTTAYSYLELRFCRGLRTAASVLFIVKTCVYLGIVLYAPALVISTVTPIPMYVCILVTGGMATAYTIKGGMHAVVWTDFIQSVVMIAVALITFFAAVTCINGGFGEVISVLRAHGMMVKPSYFKPMNPFAVRVRGAHPAESFWAVAVGGIFQNLAQCSCDQIAVQRFMTTPNLRACRTGIFQNTAVSLLMQPFISGLGLLFFVVYTMRGEDPVQADLDGDADRLFPYFVLHELPHGMAGLLLAAVCGSTMSVCSGCLNSAAASLYVDIIENAFGRRPSGDAAVVSTSKVIVFILAVASIGMAFSAELLGGLVRESVTLLGCALGPLLGTNLLGMLTNRTNAQGACAGLIISICLMLWIFIVAPAICPTEVECSAHGKMEILLQIGHMSFFWSSAVGCFASFLFGYFISFLFSAPRTEDLVGLTVWTTGQRQTSCAPCDPLQAGRAELLNEQDLLRAG